MYYYNTKLVIVFLIGGSLYLLWSYLFFNKRKKINHLQFLANSSSQTSTIEIFQGIEDIKLNTCGNNKLEKWKKDKNKVFNIGLKGLFLEQVQGSVAGIINHCKNLLFLFICVNLVISERLSLGGLFALTYINAQLDYPMTLLLGILRSYQDADLALTRLDEVSKIEEEDYNLKNNAINHIEENLNGDIVLKNVSFKYDITSEDNILQSINMKIRKGEVIAIVGDSGSGKTTLLRLILGLYKPNSGEIIINNINLNSICKDKWRKMCGVVMQDGYIFSDTIANNVSISADNQMDENKVIESLKLASIYEFIKNCPLGISTIIGEDGVKMSKGQLQRILLARAIYKNPQFLFLDEPTNSLDAINENLILKELKNVYVDKTVFIIAHRFSTIKNANRIVVLKNGKIAESGTHDELFKHKSVYYNLLINQKILND